MAPSIWQLLIVLVIVLLLFGTKRLKGLGGDLGGAIKGFKNAMTDEDKKNGDSATVDQEDPAKVTDDTGQPIDDSVAQKESSNSNNKS